MYLAELLPKAKGLRCLALGSNSVGAEATVALAAVLKRNKSLVDLSLDLNQVGDRGEEGSSDIFEVESIVYIYI